MHPQAFPTPVGLHHLTALPSELASQHLPDFSTQSVSHDTGFEQFPFPTCETFIPIVEGPLPFLKESPPRFLFFAFLKSRTKIPSPLAFCSLPISLLSAAGASLKDLSSSPKSKISTLNFVPSSNESINSVFA